MKKKKGIWDLVCLIRDVLHFAKLNKNSAVKLTVYYKSVDGWQYIVNYNDVAAVKHYF